MNPSHYNKKGHWEAFYINVVPAYKEYNLNPITCPTVSYGVTKGGTPWAEYGTTSSRAFNQLLGLPLDEEFAVKYIVDGRVVVSKLLHSNEGGFKWVPICMCIS